MSALRIGICGGGVGGLCAAIGLRAMGHDAIVHEQARQFARIGADVNLTPNAVHALDRLGIGEDLRRTAARPAYRISRTWDTGEETSRLPMSDEAETRYGAPQLTIHRGDLLRALEDKLPGDAIRLGKKVEKVVVGDGSSTIVFADGGSEEFDVVIGADGIHSPVRRSLFGADDPEFTGLVSYRAVVPQSKLDIDNLDSFTKWWGPTPDVQIVTFPLTRGEETFVFATTPQDDWREESWTLEGDVKELQESYRGFHPDVQKLLAACTTVTKSALYVRAPMPRWSKGTTTILGDAAHPMVPFMAQGACMAIEDAVVLARALQTANRTTVPAALRAYEDTRRERTARIQAGSRANDWMKGQGNADWVYDYKAWDVPLECLPA